MGDERRERTEHNMPKEGPIEELIINPLWANEYVAVRLGDNKIGLKIACDSDPNEVYYAIKMDRKNFPDCMYFLFKPVVAGQDREALLIGSYREAQRRKS